jgi:glycerol-1-phosphate dehydrogenase [NAD(P)+]
MMDVQKLLAKGSFHCSCGRDHRCDTKTLDVGGSEIYGKIPGLLGDVSRVLVISDGNTRPLCGEKVISELAGAGIQVDEAFFDQTEVLIPNEKTIAEANACFHEGDAAVIGIGSGVINDLSKYIAFDHNVPSMIVATAPSMDGFASSGAVMMLGGLKVTCQKKAPRWILADMAVLKDAPIDMIRSGLGDVMGKFSALSDWKIATLMGNEPPCDMIYDLVENEIKICVDNIEAIMNRDEKAIGKLMESLAVIGLTLAWQGSSRPASGSEHLISHFFELTCVKNHLPYFPHGIDVAYASIVTEILRKKLAGEDPETFVNTFNEADWKAGLVRCFGDMAPDIEVMQVKNQTYTTDRLPFIKAHWDEIRGYLNQTPGVEFMMDKLTKAGYQLSEFTDMYGIEKIKDAVHYASDIKTRYTLLQLLRDTGKLEAYADALVLK